MARTTGTVTVLFAGVVASTELLAAVGDVPYDDLRRRLQEQITGIVAGHDGTVVKWLGDGVMATFASAGDGLRAGADVQRAAAWEGRVQLRVGLSVGDVVPDGDDCHGTAVVEASRLCGAAAAAQVLCTDLVAPLARGQRDLTTDDIGLPRVGPQPGRLRARRRHGVRHLAHDPARVRPRRAGRQRRPRVPHRRRPRRRRPVARRRRTPPPPASPTPWPCPKSPPSPPASTTSSRPPAPNPAHRHRRHLRDELERQPRPRHRPRPRPGRRRPRPSRRSRRPPRTRRRRRHRLRRPRPGGRVPPVARLALDRRGDPDRAGAERAHATSRADSLGMHRLACRAAPPD
jgi:class 3 adenylate cyclase